MPITDTQREIALRLYKQATTLNKTIQAAANAGLTVEVIATDVHQFSPLWTHVPRWRLDLRVDVAGEKVEGES